MRVSLTCAFAGLLVFLGNAAAASAQSCTSSDVQSLMLNVSVSAPSHIYVTGPYPAGTILFEDSGTNPKAPKPVSLQIGSTEEAGSFCAYWIDDDANLVKDRDLPSPPPIYDFPSERFNHPARLAWTKQGTSGEFGVASISSTLTVYPYAGATPGPYTSTSDLILAGVPVTFGTGEFAAQLVAPKDRRLQPTTVVPPPEGGCLLQALIVDGGDKNGYLTSGIASNVAADAELMNTWLAGRGFTVKRISQYWKNPNPAYPNGQEQAMLFADIAGYVNLYTNTPTGGDCHHEFFLYVSSHGDEYGAFYLYDSDGSGNSNAVAYKETFMNLNAFPTDAQHQTTVYTMFDACYSGLAIPSAKGQFTVMPRNPAGHLGLQTLAAAGALHTAAAGHTAFADSATEDFHENSKTMTTGFKVMVHDSGGRNPARLREPDQANPSIFTLDP
jgi:hypothetical protein